MGNLSLKSKHRLMCGDSTNPDDVAVLMDGETPNLMVTDPPYGVEYDASWRNDALSGGGRATGKVENDGVCDWRETFKLFPGNVMYIWHGALKVVDVAASITDAGFVLRSHIIWAKNRFAISRGHYHYQHEGCFYVVRKGAAANWQGARDQSTLWDVPITQKLDTGHRTQKPVALMAPSMLNNSEKGDIVYEPFSGSGTTIIAGEQNDRRVFAMEISPKYVDVAVKRWENLTGGKAVLE